MQDVSQAVVELTTGALHGVSERLGGRVFTGQMTQPTVSKH